MAHYDCSCCGESMGISHNQCENCKAGNCHAESKPRKRVYVSMRTGGVAKAREWAGKPYFELSTLPEVCPRCGGGGRKKIQGCFGRHDVGDCPSCRGKGRVTKEKAEIVRSYPRRWSDEW